MSLLKVENLVVGYGPRTEAWLLKPVGAKGRLPGVVALHDHGGFYFTDHGLSDESRRMAHMTGILYAAADGSAIREVVFPANEPNGNDTTTNWAPSHVTAVQDGEVRVSGPFADQAERRVVEELVLPRTDVHGWLMRRRAGH